MADVSRCGFRLENEMISTVPGARQEPDGFWHASLHLVDERIAKMGIKIIHRTGYREMHCFICGDLTAVADPDQDMVFCSKEKHDAHYDEIERVL